MRRPSRPAAVIATAVTCASFALAAPAGAKTDPPSVLTVPVDKPPTSAPRPTIVHETIAGTNTDDVTLPITLATGALLVAIGGAGYSITAVTRLKRRTTRQSA
jgi:hypothetical protein